MPAMLDALKVGEHDLSGVRTVGYPWVGWAAKHLHFKVVLQYRIHTQIRLLFLMNNIGLTHRVLEQAMVVGTGAL